MKIVSVERRIIYYVETDEEEYNNYLRHGADNWDIRMGESYETESDCKELEQKFQEYLNNR